MNEKILLFLVVTLLCVLGVGAQNKGVVAQNKGVVAVMVSADSQVKPSYLKDIKSYFEEGLNDYGFSPIEMGEDFVEAIQEVNKFLQEGTVSEFAFDDVESEERPNFICHIRVKYLAKGSYSVEVSMTEYGKTNSKKKKVYPDYSMGDKPLNLEKDTQRKERLAVMCLLERLGYSKSSSSSMSSNSSVSSSSASSSSSAYAYGKQIEKDERSVNGKALVASLFIPGAGQFYKQDYKGGSAFLVSELALVGGGTACFFLKQKQQKIIDSEFSLQDEIEAARKNKSVCNIAMFTCFGLAAAVHIGNMIHAWYTPDNNTKRFSLNIIPAIIPTNEFLQPSFAMGAGVQIKF